MDEPIDPLRLDALEAEAESISFQIYAVIKTIHCNGDGIATALLALANAVANVLHNADAPLSLRKAFDAVLDDQIERMKDD